MRGSHLDFPHSWQRLEMSRESAMYRAEMEGHSTVSSQIQSSLPPTFTAADNRSPNHLHIVLIATGSVASIKIPLIVEELLKVCCVIHALALVSQIPLLILAA